MRYYAVTVQRGHCGCGRTTPITFYLEASNLLDAMDKAKRMPSVKHDRLCTKAVEITKECYDKAIQESSYHREESVNIIRKLKCRKEKR